MNKNVEKVLDATVETADSVYGAATDRMAERLDQAGENFEKNKETAKSAIKTGVCSTLTSSS